MIVKYNQWLGIYGIKSSCINDTKQDTMTPFVQRCCNILPSTPKILQYKKKSCEEFIS